MRRIEHDLREGEVRREVPRVAFGQEIFPFVQGVEIPPENDSLLSVGFELDGVGTVNVRLFPEVKELLEWPSSFAYKVLRRTAAGYALGDLPGELFVGVDYHDPKTADSRFHCQISFGESDVFLSSENAAEDPITDGGANFNSWQNDGEDIAVQVFPHDAAVLRMRFVKPANVAPESR